MSFALLVAGFMYAACSPSKLLGFWDAFHSLLLSCRGQRIAFNALLNACAKTGMMAAAEELLASMLKHGPSPDIISYNTLISGHALVSLSTSASDTVKCTTVKYFNVPDASHDIPAYAVQVSFPSQRCTCGKCMVGTSPA